MAAYFRFYRLIWLKILFLTIINSLHIVNLFISASLYMLSTLDKVNKACGQEIGTPWVIVYLFKAFRNDGY